MTMAVRLAKSGVLGALLVAAVGCSSGGGAATNHEQPGVPRGAAVPPTCEGALKDPFFNGTGRVVLSLSSGDKTRCNLDFPGDSAVLRRLGLHSVCDGTASVGVIVELDPHAKRW